MAFEEVLQLLAKREALEAKRAEVMRLSMLATAEMLASGEVAPGDPELVAVAARAEAHGLATVRAAAEQDARMAARYAAEPGGEAVAEAMRRLAARAAALGALAEYYAAYMGAVGSLADPDSDSEDDDSEAVNSI